METLQLLGSLAEVASALAVVVALAFLVMQVRDSKRVIAENSRVIRAAALDMNFDHMSRWRGRIIESAEVARIWSRGCAGEPLEAEDRARFAELAKDVYLARMFAHFRLHSTGSADVAETQVRLLAELCAEHPGLRRWVETSREVSANPFHLLLMRQLESLPGAQADRRS